MAKVAQQKFGGGIADDVRQESTNSCIIARNFDLFSNPNRLTPYRSLETDDTDVKTLFVRDFLYASASAKLYGLGQTGAGLTKIVFKANAISGAWTLLASSEGNGAVKNGCFVEYKDYIWAVNPRTFPQLLNLSIGNTPVFLPAGGMSGLPYNVLLGRPYFDTEYNPTLGEVGDLLLVSPSAYPMIEKAGGVQAASSIHVGFLTDESVFRFVVRIDGSPSWRTTLTGNDGITYSPFVALTTST
jgi:hypothetical protein